MQGVCCSNILILLSTQTIILHNAQRNMQTLHTKPHARQVKQVLPYCLLRGSGARFDMQHLHAVSHTYFISLRCMATYATLIRL